MWKCGFEEALSQTKPYLQLVQGFDEDLLVIWKTLIDKCPDEWAQMIGMPNEIVDDDNEEALDVEDLNLGLQYTLSVKTYIHFSWFEYINFS